MILKECGKNAVESLIALINQSTLMLIKKTLEQVFIKINQGLP